MSEEQSQTRRVVTVTEGTREPEPVSFAEFLETVPPSQLRHISPLVEGKSDQVLTPKLQLHCTESFCNGVRFFRHDESDYELLMSSEFIYFYMRYLCSNCQRGSKIFAIAAKKDEGKSTSGQARKLGETPPYGPPTSSRLISLIGPDRELFLSGRRCETQGLGVGAFAYYRRVVENQKGRIIQSIIKVAERSSASTDVIYKLKKAEKETRFSEAVASIKDAIPSSLLIRGQRNPITLLHSALSYGLHDRGDEECLQLARDVRVVLAELSERIAQALADERELNDAVSRLMDRER